MDFLSARNSKFVDKLAEAAGGSMLLAKKAWAEVNQDARCKKNRWATETEILERVREHRKRADEQRDALLRRRAARAVGG